MLKSILLTVSLLCVVCSLALAQDDAPTDAEGCKDSPLISRFPGGHISSCDNKEFEQFQVPTGKDQNGEIVQKTLEGEFHSWDYTTHDGVSEIQVFRNFDTALKQAGFKIDYEEPPNNITAHKGDTWIYLESKGTFYYQTIVTVKEMKQEVTADASSLSDEINKSGHVAVYGIHFETAKSAILPDSADTLQQIVKLLEDSPDLKLRIEGYTDNVGAEATNLALSEKRAQAVVGWLVANGVDGSRLMAKGLGAANPVADNGSEEGRAKNRRVELAKM